jgi:hypothetical protein
MEHENELLNEIEVSASEEYFSRVDFIFNLFVDFIIEGYFVSYH